jgi:hypothetical protein
MNPPLLELPHLLEIAHARASLAPRFYAIVAALGSPRAVWEALHGAGVFPEPVGRYYASLRRFGVETTLDALFTAERLPAIRRFVEGPRAVGPPRVSVSTLANQFYCEMQVHLARTHTLRTESAELAAGAAGHAAFEAEAEEITQEEISEAITAGEPLELVEMPVTAEIHGVRLVGRADRIHLEGRRGRLVLEFKFSGRRELFPSHVVQVEAYGRMLESMGFQTDRLLYGVAVLPRGRRVSDALARKIAEAAFEVARAGLSATDARPPSGVPDPLSGLTVRRVDDEAFGLWVFRHSRQRVERDLQWATSYWTGARAPEGTMARGKCRACPFNAAELCGVSKAPPDGRYAVRRTLGRFGVTHVVQPSSRR